MQRLGEGGTEDPGELAYTVILCHLKVLDQALLMDPGVLNRCPVCKHGDDQGVVDLTPVHEVEASDRVAKNADSVYCRAGAVGHD